MVTGLAAGLSLLLSGLAWDGSAVIARQRNVSQAKKMVKRKEKSLLIGLPVAQLPWVLV
jgi:hypothetical protein